MGFSSITIDGNSDGDFLQQRLHGISRQKEELQHMEIDLRAQMIARSEIASMRNSFESQVKEHADVVAKLQDQLHDKEKGIHDLEKKMEEKDRELLAVKRDNEAAWAKEDLLREQKKELATFRRELDHSEAERFQHIKQLHDLQEHLQDKERQLIDMQDQHRVAQETIIYKDEQLREAQSWIARAQEMDALQSQSLQAELRERTEQCQQLWLGWQRQIMEVERFHLHTIQQLQLELADARERSGSYTNEPVQQVTSEPSQFGQKDANVSNAVGPNAKSGAISNASLDRSSIAPNSNMQRAPHSLPSNLTQAPVSHYQPHPVLTFQELQKAQAASEGLQNSTHSKADRNSVSSELDMKFDYQVAVNGQAHQRDYVEDVRISGVMEHSAKSSSAGEAVIIQSTERSLNGHEVESQGLAADKSASGADASEINLLEERSVLACIVRTIPIGGKIRISSTLLNRLGKMLAPLHWHDYKKKYGKLDDFMGTHPELFVIEGDYIQLQEGAQDLIAAKAAAAKFAAAVVASAPQNMPSVAVTPMANAYRFSKVIPSTDPKILSKSGNPLELNGLEHRVGAALQNGANGRSISSFVKTPPGRATGSASASRR